MIVTFALQAEHPYFPVFPRVDLLTASIRKHLPDAKIVQLSNLDFPAADDVDEVIRIENKGDFIEWAFTALIQLLERGEPVIQLATDIIVTGELSSVFNDEFDVAACRYPAKDRGDGAFCGDVNFINQSGIGLWKDSLEYYRLHPEIRDGWEGGQTAMLEVAKTGKYSIKELPYDVYCYTPEDYDEDISAAKIVHFRGNRKGMMGYYAKKMNLMRLYNPKVVCNVSDDTIEQNVDYALSLPHEILADQYKEPDGAMLVIVGGGPSLSTSLPDIYRLQEEGAIIWALNNSFRYLCEKSIEPHAHVMLDARPENADFIPEKTNATLLYSAQCHSSVFEKAVQTDGKILIWCPSVGNIDKKLKEKNIRAAIIAGGSSVGIKALGLAKVFGFKDIYLYGYDSSYHDGQNHAYDQSLNNKERIIDITLRDRTFKCAPWMATQASEFRDTVNQFIEQDNMVFHVGGYGLLPYMASIMRQEAPKNE
jgi:hypothetical protein